MSTDRKIIGKCKGLPRGEYGFSIIEIMVGLVIVAVLGVIGSTSLRSLVNSFQASNTPRQVAAALHTARLKAIRQHTNYKVVFYPDTSHQDACHGNVTVNSPSYQVYTEVGDCLANEKAVSLPTPVKFRDSTPTTFTNHTVGFTTTGALTTAPPTLPGTIYLKGATDQQQYRITVDHLTGRIKVLKGWQ